MEEDNILEASFYSESHEANPKKKDPELERLLEEVSQSFQSFEIIRKVKQKFLKALHKQGIDEQCFADFELHTMDVLNHLSKDSSVVEFLCQAYIGCIQCILCLQNVRQSSSITKLIQRLSAALNVVGNVLSEQRSMLPDSGAEAKDYEETTLAHLSELTDEYLVFHESLREYKQLIEDFQVVNEIEFALGYLRDAFEELKRGPEHISHRYMLFAEMEERTDFTARFSLNGTWHETSV